MDGGLYARVAKKLRLNASYVSRVANGERTSERIIEYQISNAPIRRLLFHTG